jgi:hypothetical protein
VYPVCIINSKQTGDKRPILTQDIIDSYDFSKDGDLYAVVGYIVPEHLIHQFRYFKDCVLPDDLVLDYNAAEYYHKIYRYLTVHIINSQFNNLCFKRR